jgi:hypothetical protein
MASVFAPLVPSGEKFVYGDFSRALPKAFDALDRTVDFATALIALGYEARDGTAVAGDNQSLSTLHVIEQLGEMHLGFGGLNFTHDQLPLFDWSVQLV